MSPYDAELAERLRALLDDRDPIEKRMFGGVGFMVGGKLAIVASSKGGIMVRVDPARSDELCEEDGVERMVMRDKPMDGWLRVTTDRVDSDEELTVWIDRGVSAAAAAA